MAGAYPGHDFICREWLLHNFSKILVLLGDLVTFTGNLGTLFHHNSHVLGRNRMSIHYYGVGRNPKDDRL